MGDSEKTNSGYEISNDGRTLAVLFGESGHTAQGKYAMTKDASGRSSNRFFFKAEFSGAVGCIGIATANNPNRVNINNDLSYLLSSDGKLYEGGLVREGFGPLVSSRINGRTQYELLVDLSRGTLQYWVDGKDLGENQYKALRDPCPFTRRARTWYLTVSFGDEEEAAFELVPPPRHRTSWDSWEPI